MSLIEIMLALSVPAVFVVMALREGMGLKGAALAVVAYAAVLAVSVLVLWTVGSALFGLVTAYTMFLSPLEWVLPRGWPTPVVPPVVSFLLAAVVCWKTPHLYKLHGVLMWIGVATTTFLFLFLLGVTGGAE